MKSFFAACLVSFALAEELIQSGVTDDADIALTATFVNMTVPFTSEQVPAQTASNLYAWYDSVAAVKPEMCEIGQACRADIKLGTVNTIEDQWVDVQARISAIFEN